MIYDLLSFALVTLAITYGMTETTPMMPYRMLMTKLLVRTSMNLSLVFVPALYCPACTGFWVGLVVGAAYFHTLGWFAVLKAAFAGLVMGKVWTKYVADVATTFAGEVSHDKVLSAMLFGQSADNDDDAGESNGTTTQEEQQHGE